MLLNNYIFILKVSGRKTNIHNAFSYPSQVGGGCVTITFQLKCMIDKWISDIVESLLGDCGSPSKDKKDIK